MWNGTGWNRNASQFCTTYNLGRTTHPAKCLDKHGNCIYKHRCDHYVLDDKGARGLCGEPHARVNCDNKRRCDADGNLAKSG